MTPPADEIEKEGKVLHQIWRTCGTPNSPTKEIFESLAAHVIRERKKAVIEAEVKTAKLFHKDYSESNKICPYCLIIQEYESQLSELERGEK